MVFAIGTDQRATYGSIGLSLLSSQMPFNAMSLGLSICSPRSSAPCFIASPASLPAWTMAILAAGARREEEGCRWAPKMEGRAMDVSRVHGDPVGLSLGFSAVKRGSRTFKHYRCGRCPLLNRLVLNVRMSKRRPTRNQLWMLCSEGHVLKSTKIQRAYRSRIFCWTPVHLPFACFSGVSLENPSQKEGTVQRFNLLG